jgi:hypothetical protein
MKALAGGDLTQRLQAQTAARENHEADELAAVERAIEDVRATYVGMYSDYNQAADTFRTAISEIQSAALIVGGSSGQLTLTAEEAGRATGEIALDPRRGQLRGVHVDLVETELWPATGGAGRPMVRTLSHIVARRGL